MNRESGDEVVLDLTAPEDEGFDLLFRTSKHYLGELRQQIERNEFDGLHSIVLVFEDAHPVAARVDNYLSGTHYDSIGVTDVGKDEPWLETDRNMRLRLTCNRHHLRRFAALNRISLKTPVTFTVQIPPDNAELFVRSVTDIIDK